ncbi:large ribosomal subunit protein bL20-like [Dysidea avara]|uniref:large ribosomal subunit protein bL20-like n=1 Tax=Dysidea avara TaxID=196820 RepID=UPI0033294296
MVRARLAQRTRLRKKAKVFAMTKGFRGRRKNCYSLAVRAAHKAMQYAYIGRKLKKRFLRSLWIQRITYAVQEHKLPYNTFIRSLVMAHIQLNRKVLSELAIHEPRTFKALAEIARKRSQEGLAAALETKDPKRHPRLVSAKMSRRKRIYETAV